MTAFNAVLDAMGSGGHCLVCARVVFKEDAVMFAGGCGHAAHRQCVAVWTECTFDGAPGVATCPLCRENACFSVRPVAVELVHGCAHCQDMDAAMGVTRNPDSFPFIVVYSAVTASRDFPHLRSLVVGAVASSLAAEMYATRARVARKAAQVGCTVECTS